jgi:chitinase
MERRALGPANQSAPALHVVGYYADWTAGRYPLAGIPAGKLTHVNYAFAKIGPDNKITFNAGPALNTVYPGDCAEAGCPHGLFNQITLIKQKFPHLKFMMSVGGWTDSGPFYEMAAGDESRRTFVESCAAFLKTYPQFDGIDIDWEHPVAGGLQPGQPRDAQTYLLLLQDLRRVLGSGKLLTVAASASQRGIEPLLYGEMSKVLDFVNVMAYDYHSGSRAHVGYNSALYDNKDPQHPTSNTHSSVQMLIGKGVPPAKVVVGVPFYGRGWSGVESAAVWSAAGGTMQVGGYTVIAEKFLAPGSGFVRAWDDVAKMPSLYNATTKEWITYEDPQSMRLKGEYIVAQKLGGAMFWELSNDNGTLLDALRTGLGLH